MIADQLPNLFQVLAGYFNQDWGHEFDDESAVLDAISKAEDREHVKKACTEIDELLSGNFDEAELRNIIVEDLSCYYDANSQNISYSSWLLKMKKSLAENRAYKR